MSSQSISSSKIKIWLAVGWLIFNTAMVLWWGSFILADFKNSEHPQDHYKYRMLFSEGIFFLVSNFVGGVSLIVLLQRDKSRQKTLKNFFSSFSHDLKTTLSRLRLQSDLLKEQALFKQDSNLLRMTDEITNLDLQLENSLYLAQEEEPMFVESEIHLAKMIESLRNEFENIEISLDKKVILNADRRALMSVFRNLFHNAIIHGRASKITIQTESLGRQQIKIIIQDNGQGFSGDLARLGLFPRFENKQKTSETISSGQGLGLFLCRQLMHKQKGRLEFVHSASGFCSHLTLPGRVL